MKQLSFLQPKPLPFSYEDWKAKPFHERVKMLCIAWATQGYGAPIAVYSFYLLKMMFYVSMWGFFCSFHSELGSWNTVGDWWYKLEALQVAIVWSILFEILGLGCGSGPLTARYMPPVGAFLHWLRPGTVKLPLFPKLPFLGADTRNLLDILLYILLLSSLVNILISSTVSLSQLIPIFILLPLLGILDQSIFLAARSEHYLIALFCFLFPEDTLAGLKLVWLAIWWGAASSKLNRHFPTVVGVMISNHAVLRSTWLRKKLYKNYPEDLRPSNFSKILAHLGTATEYLFPVILLLGIGGNLTLLGLVIMLGFHLYITSSVPMGVPLEWNIIMVYGAFLLFGYHAVASPFSLESPMLICVLGFSLVLLPLLGNLFPKWISFLLSMRYYAGNWAYSVWLFKGNLEEKMDKNIKKSNLTLRKQLSLFYDKDTFEPLADKVIAFRCMHLHGRALQELLPKAVDDIEAYTYRDGEIIAGLVLGWNFGEGHLHGKQLLHSIQKRCKYASGELRCIFVEAQPLFQADMAWKIYDAKDGLLEAGKVNVQALTELQPWREEK